MLKRFVHGKIQQILFIIFVRLQNVSHCYKSQVENRSSNKMRGAVSTWIFLVWHTCGRMGEYPTRPLYFYFAFYLLPLKHSLIPYLKHTHTIVYVLSSHMCQFIPTLVILTLSILTLSIPTSPTRQHWSNVEYGGDLRMRLASVLKFPNTVPVGID